MSNWTHCSFAFRDSVVYALDNYQKRKNTAVSRRSTGIGLTLRITESQIERMKKLHEAVIQGPSEERMIEDNAETKTTMLTDGMLYVCITRAAKW